MNKKITAVIAAVLLASGCSGALPQQSGTSEDSAASLTETSEQTTAVSEEIPETNTDTAVSSYCVFCKDLNGEPVPGVILKVRSDSLCTHLVTDGTGSASYPASDGKCEICVETYPKTYTLCDDICIITSSEEPEYCFYFTAAEDSLTAGTETAGALTAEISDGTVLLKWEPADGADAYRVYMCDENGENGRSLVRTLDTDYTVRDIEPGKAYIFRVVPLTKDGGSYIEAAPLGEVKVTADGSVIGISQSADSQPVQPEVTGAQTTEPPAFLTLPPETSSATTVTTAEPVKWTACDFPVYDKNGKKMMLSDLAGKPVIINVWATWCSYCIDELPVFSKLYAKYGDRINFVMLSIDDPGYEEDVIDFVKSYGWSFPVYFDSEYNSTYVFGNTVPVTAAINAKGELVKTHSGAISASGLESLVKSLLG